MADAEHTKNTAPAATRNRRSTTAFARRALVVLAVVLLALLAVEAGSACLPDLAAIAVTDAASDATTPIGRFEGCGDGIIATLDDGGDAGESCDPGTDAAVPGCTADCRIECAGALDPITGHCYFVAGSDSTYESASTHCKLARSHLVTFASNEEAKLVETRVAADAGALATYWVGLLRSGATSNAYGASDPDQPGFPSPPKGPCSGCFGIGADDAGIFPVETDAGAGTTATDCIASRGGAWVQVPCTTTTTMRTTICEREPIGARAQDCIGGFCFTLPSTLGKKRYLVAVAAADPETAAESCGGLDGGSLVLFGSREEREQLAHEITVRYPNTQQALWIGLTEDGGAWVWDDGVAAVEDANASRPLPWGDKQPITLPGARAYMQLTGAYDTQLAYADDGGKTPRLYICQRPATD